MQVVAYARVSSREQEKEGYSIPAQVNLLKEYATRNGFTIVNTYSEAETAKQSGREEFNGMLSFLAKEGKAQGIRTILVEKTDRLYRNFKDYVRLEDLDVEVHFVKEGEILSKDSRSHIKFIHGIKVLMAKNYCDNLSEEVKKGKLEKARQGHYPLKAPFGYKNNRDTRLIDVFEPEAKWVKRAYDLYASGNYSLNQLRDTLHEEGFVFRPSQPKIYKSSLHNLLNNVFYTGDFIMNGQFYHGKHTPIIPLSLFEKVQEVFDQANRPKKTKKDFAFAGLITCGNCGCSVTPQIQKEKYVYYHCSNGKGKCGDKYVREETIAEQFVEALNRLRITDSYMEAIKKALKDSHQEEKAFHDECLKDLRQRYDVLTRRIDAIYEDKLDGKIPEELWFRKHEEYKQEQSRINERLNQHEKGNYNYVESGILLLELAQNASARYARRSPAQQRQLLNFLLSNCTLKAGKLDYTYNKPFDVIAEGLCFEKTSG